MSQSPILPLPGFALVQIDKAYQSGLIADKDKYSTNSHGTLLNFTILNDGSYININIEDLIDYYNQFKNKTVYFSPYEDGEEIKLNDQQYVLIPIKALRGGKL